MMVRKEGGAGARDGERRGDESHGVRGGGKDEDEDEKWRDEGAMTGEKVI